MSRPAQPNDTMLHPGQKLTEMWEIVFEGRESRGPGGYRRVVTGSVGKWYHGTIYGGSTGEGQTVGEARLAMVLGLARAIADDENAFEHDTEQLYKKRTLSWLEGRKKELEDELELMLQEWDEDDNPPGSKKIYRRIGFMEELIGVFCEEHDYFPDPEDAPGSKNSREEDTRTARASLIKQARVVRQATEDLAAKAS